MVEFHGCCCIILYSYALFRESVNDLDKFEEKSQQKKNSCDYDSNQDGKSACIIEDMLITFYCDIQSQNQLSY